MTASKSDIGTAPQHWFSESRWSQHSETAFKVHLLCRCIKLKKSHPWPTDYHSLNSFSRPGRSVSPWICHGYTLSYLILQDRRIKAFLWAVMIHAQFLPDQWNRDPIIHGFFLYYCIAIVMFQCIQFWCILCEIDSLILKVIVMTKTLKLTLKWWERSKLGLVWCY